MTHPVLDLRALFSSRHGLILASARDENRLVATISETALQLRIPVWTWSAAGGLRAAGQPRAQLNTEEPKQALGFIKDLNRPAVVIFLDADPILNDTVALRALKELAGANMPGRTLVLTGIGTQIPSELTGLAVSWSLPAANRTEMRQVVDRVLQSMGTANLRVNTVNREALVDAVLGLTPAEAERIIMREALTDGSLDPGDEAAIHRARAAILSDDSPLDLLDPDAKLTDVGGLENLKQWLTVRGAGFEPAAREFGLDAPRGVLLAGVPGCGKSLVARAIAGSWGMALAALDTGRLHGSLVGESEKRLQRALSAAEAMAPVVLWIDEIEKAFAKPGDNDGGVSSRVLSVLLSWLQERPEGVFVVATSNDVNKLPPEVTRRGRFDEVFFVDLPSVSERAAILAYHLAERRRDPKRFDIARLADATDGFSGAELESALTSALYLAYSARTPLQTQQLLAEFADTVPLSQMRAEDVAALRTWARGRARPAQKVPA
ncbi:MAG: AAA family ATPase [Actinomycetia bacterium]|nr:AAA family ATPase [Actinomycetes bacterium]